MGTAGPKPVIEAVRDATLTADNGATNYFRVDWFTPDGLGAWGDGRCFILGTDGYIELRKYLDIARDEPLRCKVVDASGDAVEVHERVLALVLQVLSSREPAALAQAGE